MVLKKWSNKKFKRQGQEKGPQPASWTFFGSVQAGFLFHLLFVVLSGKLTSQQSSASGSFFFYRAISFKQYLGLALMV
jgi:hypothetical protein